MLTGGFGRVAIATALALGLTAACSNPGIDEGAATLRLLEARPARDASGAAAGAAVVLTFNERVDRDTLRGAFSLRDAAGGGPVFGVFVVDGRTARFEPEVPLRLGARYEVAIDSTIRGANGATLEAPLSWRFTTKTGALGAARKLGTIASFDSVFHLRVALDATARPWAAWLEDTVSFSKQVKVRQPQAIVVAAQSADGRSFERSHRVVAPTVSSALAPSCFGFTRGGEGYLVWQQRDAGDDRLLLARYAEQRWGAFQVVASSSTREIAYPRCAFDAARGLHVVWLEKNAKRPADNVIEHRLYDVAGDELGDAATILRGGAARELLATVSLQRAGDKTRIYFASSQLSTVFLEVATIGDGKVEDDTTIGELGPSVSELQMAEARGGATFFLWKETATSSETLWTLSRASDKVGWSSPHKLVEQPKASAPSRSHVAVHQSGDALVSWRQPSAGGGGGYDVYTASYRADAKRWDAPALLSVAGGAAHHASAIEPGGEPLVLFVTPSAPSEDLVRRTQRASSGAWSSPATIARHGAGSVVFPASSVAALPGGRTAFWWYERKRNTRDVGGVILQWFDLELWTAWVEPTP